MVLAEMLFDVWVTQFEVYWEDSIVPSSWREILIVPVPKKETRCACDTNTY